jgi:hypothetical protein
MAIARRAPSLIKASMACALLAMTAAPATAQLFWKPADLSTPPLTGAEPTIGVNMPGASEAELRAGLVWQLRSALNVAALQCDFEPTLLTTSNYNAMLAQHRTELASAFNTVGSYFTRTQGKVAGQKSLDQYGTRTYSGFSTVKAQLTFCQVAGSVGRDAIFAPRGQLYTVAAARLGEIKKALTPAGEQYFTNPLHGYVATLPPLSKQCWKNGKIHKRCAKDWPPQG